MSDVKVDKGVPVPDARAPGRPGKYPWEKMEVGDSFFVAGCRSSKSSRGSGTILNLSVPRARYPDRKWVSRKVVEGGVTGVRVWRVK